MRHEPRRDRKLGEQSIGRTRDLEIEIDLARVGACLHAGNRHQARLRYQRQLEVRAPIAQEARAALDPARSPLELDYIHRELERCQARGDRPSVVGHRNCVPRAVEQPWRHREDEAVVAAAQAGILHFAAWHDRRAHRLHLAIDQQAQRLGVDRRVERQRGAPADDLAGVDELDAADDAGGADRHCRPEQEAAAVDDDRQLVRAMRKELDGQSEGQMRQRAGRVERQLMAAERRSRLHHRAPHLPHLDAIGKCQSDDPRRDESRADGQCCHAVIELIESCGWRTVCKWRGLAAWQLNFASLPGPLGGNVTLNRPGAIAAG